MRLVISADWHLGAGLRAWGEHAPQRRRERTHAVLQVIDHARHVNADYLLVAGDIADCPEKVPTEVVEALGSLRERTGGRCRPVLFFTSKGHDGQRAWWKGDTLTSQSGATSAPKLCPGEPLPTRWDWRLDTGELLITAHEEIPDAAAVAPPPGRPWLVLLHAAGLNRQRLAPLRGKATFVACGDFHDQKELERDFAWYVGSPTFRDLSSYDEGPRACLQVDIRPAGQVHAVPLPLITATTATIRVAAGQAVSCTPGGPCRPRDVSEVAKDLLTTHRYVRLGVAREEARDVVARLRRASLSADVLEWPTRSKARCYVLLVSRSSGTAAAL